MIKVSVVIPVYNAEKFLHECIGSLLAQDETSCEFIFVNDGSADGSRKIIDEYQKKDARIIAIHQENQGVSVARNNGIAIAQGEYLAFVDGDDSVEKDFVSTLYETAKKHECDIVISNYFQELGKARILNRYDFPVNHLYEKDAIRDTILPYFIRKELLNSACNKIFRREFIIQNNIEFPKGVKLGEDAVFNMKAFNRCNRAYYTDYSGYHYREVAGSATRDMLSHNYFDRVMYWWHFDYQSVMDLKMDDEQCQKLKSEKMIDSVLSLVHLYFDSPSVSLKKRFAAVKQMLDNPEVTQTLDTHFPELTAAKNRYSRFLLKRMKKSDIFSLYLATLYSKYRNR